MDILHPENSCFGRVCTDASIHPDELDQIRLDKSVADELRRYLREGKRYFKTEYQSHCKDNESECLDHCGKFGLSDPNDPDFQEHRAH